MDIPKHYHGSIVRMTQDVLWGLRGAPETICKLYISVCAFAHLSRDQVHGFHLILKGLKVPEHRKGRTTGLKECQQDLMNKRMQAQNFPIQHWCAGTGKGTGVESPFALKVTKPLYSCWHLHLGSVS